MVSVNSLRSLGHQREIQHESQRKFNDHIKLFFPLLISGLSLHFCDLVSSWLVSCDPQDTLSSHSVLHSLLPLQEAQNSEKSTHWKRWSKGGTVWCQKTEDLDSSSPHLSLTHAVSWKQGGTTVQSTASGVPRNWVWILSLPLSVCESLTALSLSFLICRMRIKIPTFYSKIYVKCFTWYLAHS